MLITFKDNNEGKQAALDMVQDKDMRADVEEAIEIHLQGLVTDIDENEEKITLINRENGTTISYKAC